MIEKIDNYLIGICIGVRFRANFKIEDSLGEIVDKILYGKNSIFSKKVFPIVQNNADGKLLFNSMNNDKLTINNSNIVLDLFFDGSFEISDYDKIIEEFNDSIIEGILKQYKITEIVRIGIIKRYLFTVGGMADKFLSKTIGGTIDGVNDINLRFSKKFPAQEAMVKKKIYDHRNAIFNIIKQADKDELFMSIDYQKLFEPFLSSSIEMKFEDFIRSANGFTNKKYLTWINDNYLKE